MRKIFLALVAAVAALAAAPARASVIEPWRHDVSPASTPRAGHSFAAALLAAENFFEIPLDIFYGIADDVELKTRWGAVYNSPYWGISDLKFSVKYNLTRKSEEIPSVFLEGGVSLPTADHTRGLGLGGVGISFGWYMLKEMSPVDVFVGLAGEFNDNDVLSGARPPRVFSYRTGARYSLDKDIVLTGEIKGFNNYWKDPVGFKQELYLSPGVHYGGKIPFSCSLLFGISEDARRVAFYAEKKF